MNTQKKEKEITIKQLLKTTSNLIPFCKDYEDLLSKLQQRGYELKRGKYVSVRASTQERFTRIKTLGGDYTEEAIIQRIESKSIPFPSKKKDWNKGKVVDISNNKKLRNLPAYALTFLSITYLRLHRHFYLFNLLAIKA